MKTLTETLFDIPVTMEMQYIPKKINPNLSSQSWQEQALEFRIALSAKGNPRPMSFTYHMGLGFLKGETKKRYNIVLSRKCTDYDYDQFFNHLLNVSKIEHQIQIPIRDVLRSLASEADILNYADFTQWADEFGYSSDSIRAKSIYDACMSQTLELRQMFTLDQIEKLADEGI